MGDGYHEVDPWAGHKQWACDEGDYGPSTREDLVSEHVTKAHGQRETISGALLDAKGAPAKIAKPPPPPLDTGAIPGPEPAKPPEDTEPPPGGEPG